MFKIEDIIEKLQEYHPQVDQDLLIRARDFSIRAHSGQEPLPGLIIFSTPLKLQQSFPV